MTLISYAQNYEDVALWRVLKNVERGFYIDVGAWDPDEHSVTRVFSERGWRGINIEPASEKHALLQARRPNDVNLARVVSDSLGSVDFFEIKGTGLSTTDVDLANRHAKRGYTVTKCKIESTTLAEVCRTYAPPEIHFLKLDCEKNEKLALAGADFMLYRPWIIIIEAIDPETQKPNFTEWEHIIIEGKYKFVWFDQLNRFYVAVEHFDWIAPLVAIPPSCFDNFIRTIDLRTIIPSAKSVPTQSIFSISSMITNPRRSVSVNLPMFSQIGVEGFINNTRVFEANGGNSGWLMFGPYSFCTVGNYECTFLVRVDVVELPPEMLIFTFDSALDQVSQRDQQTFFGKDLKSGEFASVKCFFNVSRETHSLETRLWLYESLPITIVAAVSVELSSTLAISG